MKFKNYKVKFYFHDWHVGPHCGRKCVCLEQGCLCSVHAQNKYVNNHAYRNIDEPLCKVVIKFADLYKKLKWLDEVL